MNRNSVIALVIVIILLTSCIGGGAQPVKPLLRNGGFEGGTSRDTLYWTLTGGPYSTQFGEINGPEGWIAWWHEGPPCSGTPDYRLGRPEVKVISGPDPERIRSGEQAVKWFTFWHCHRGGLLQRVQVEPGHCYQFSVYAHSWFSNCDLRPHYDLPLDYDCDREDPILWAQDWLSVGIDPTGGIDPMASTVEWGTPLQEYGRYGRRLTTERILAEGYWITVIIESEASHPLKHDDFYIDDAVLRDVTHRVFLPVVRLE